MQDTITLTASQEIAHQWGWFLAFGIVIALLGLAAMIRSFAATVASMVFFGWLLVFAGGIEFIDSIMVGHWSGFFLHLLAAVFFTLTGILFLTRPVISAEAVTFMMSLFFLGSGLYQVIASLWSHMQGWGWHVFDGVLAMLMGGLLLARWPLTGLWAIGLFVGIYLFMTGISWVAIATQLRKM